MYYIIILVHIRTCVYMLCVYIHPAEIRKDVSSQFHNTLYTGDVLERVKLLRSVGQGYQTLVVVHVHVQHVCTCMYKYIRMPSTIYVHVDVQCTLVGSMLLMLCVLQIRWRT